MTVSLQGLALYQAELATGDRIAHTVERACRSAGAVVLDRPINLRTRQPVGSTIAIGTMKLIAKRQGERGLAAALKVLVKAGRGPITANELSAVTMIIRHCPDIARDLSMLIASRPSEAWVGIASVKNGEPLASAIASVWLRELDIRLSPSPQHKRPPPSPPRSIPEPSPAATTPSTNPKVVKNGIEVDYALGVVVRGGRAVKIGETHLEIMASVLTVMPALLDSHRLANKIFGVNRDAVSMLKWYVDAINHGIADIDLQIKSFKHMGYMLADLRA